MKIQHRPSDDEVRKRRQSEYLARWPVDKQLEAHSEAAAGRPEKLTSMTADFASIRETYPFTAPEATVQEPSAEGQEALPISEEAHLE